MRVFKFFFVYKCRLFSSQVAVLSPGGSSLAACMEWFKTDCKLVRHKQAEEQPCRLQGAVVRHWRVQVHGCCSSLTITAHSLFCAIWSALTDFVQY